MKKRWFFLLLALLMLLTGCAASERKARSLIEDGDLLYEKEAYEEAVQKYTEAIELLPKLPVAYNNRGLAYLKLYKNEEAAADFRKAAELEGATEHYSNLGITYVKLGDYDRAVEAFSKAIKIESRDADLYLQRARAYRDTGENTLAISDYTQALALDPENAAALNERGVVYYDTEQYQRAIQDYTAALALDPDPAAIYENRAIAYEAAGDIESAVADIRWLASHTDSGSGYFRRIADLYLQAEMYPEAIDVLREITEADPEDLDTLGKLADTLYGTGQYQEANSYYLVLVEKEPDAAVYGEIADCWLKLGDPEEALKALVRCGRL